MLSQIPHEFEENRYQNFTRIIKSSPRISLKCLVKVNRFPTRHGQLLLSIFRGPHPKHSNLRSAFKASILHKRAMPNPAQDSEDWEIIYDRHKSFDCRKSSTDDLTGINATLLIPGVGEPLHDQAIICDKITGKIIYVGGRSSIPSKYGGIELQDVPVVLPGLWECHSHFMGASPNKAIVSHSHMSRSKEPKVVCVVLEG